ncbi:MAG: hypothetical protein ISR43_03590 [Acidimicrobiia bacterium]|nr:hypothetical protein [Actinomycetota bacterium]MBL6924138.1 hypothetical protein [Acidimicrobiia bacterium]MBL6926294.1 hypothetical protein [Acidimicrobiia bacterium]
MVGAVIMIIVLVVLIPVGILVGGAVGAAALGRLLKGGVDSAHEDSELLGVSEANPWAGPSSS